MSGVTHPALEISQLHAWYGESHILHNVNLIVNQGEVVTLLGRNGAGYWLNQNQWCGSYPITDLQGGAPGCGLLP
jgi:Fe-S cluster assembly ATPase SufC